MPTNATITPTCGLTTTATLATTADMMHVSLDVDSQCAAIRKIAAELPQVNPYMEMSRNGEGRLLDVGRELCSHTSCPVPSAFIKGAEIEAGLDLPKPVIIEYSKE